LCTVDSNQYSIKIIHNPPLPDIPSFINIQDMMKVIITLFTVIAFVVFLPSIDGSATIISDDRIRNLDFPIVLGRGYNVGTNTFQSTCLNVNDITTPSYNYDYKFNDFSKSTDVVKEMSLAVSTSLSRSAVGKELKTEKNY